MASIVKVLKAVAEPNRLRLLLLLATEELSVAELQEILGLGQSTISTHLSQLRQAGLVEDRRTGKSSLYRLRTENDAGSSVLEGILDHAKQEIPEAEPDQQAMRHALRKRTERTRAFFDAMAGRLGRDYAPGKSWKGVAEALLELLPPLAIADLGAGDGEFSLLLAARASRVVAVDTSEKMLAVGRERAERQGAENVEFRLGDMEKVPLKDGEMDAVFFQQSLHHALHPEAALTEAARILKPGGRVIVLDLLRHRFEEARELYADEWLGFGEAELERMLSQAGFGQVRVSVVHKEAEAPGFQTVLGVGEKQR